MKEQLNLKMLNAKYNYPVPRYTSYPPANKFTDSISSDEYIELIEISNKWAPENISIYVHIPFCNKLCHYCGCNSMLMKSDDPVKEYVEALQLEIKLAGKHIDKSRKLSQIHFGGGTPNAINVEYLANIVQTLRDEFEFIDNPEIAIECNPAYLEYDYLDKLIEIGFNRFSFGVQDFNSKVLEYINRDASKIPLNELMGYIKKVNPKISINLDFIYGLPGQTVESFIETIENAISLRPDRLVTFSYAHVPWVNENQKQLEIIGLPSSDDKIEMFEQSYRLLQESAYSPIGLDHYVVEGDELYEAALSKELHRNFQGYCTRRTTGQVYAFGVSSITQLEKAYVQNSKLVGEYIQTVRSGSLPVKKCYKVSDEQLVIREIINELMCNKNFNLSKSSQNLGVEIEKIKSILKYKKENFDIFAKDGIINGEGEDFTVVDTGILFVRNIAAALDPAFEIKEGNYSKSV